MEIYVQKNESQQGPYSLDEIRTRIETGALLPDDWGWHSKLSDWVRIRTFFEGETTPALPTFGPPAARWWGPFRGKKEFPSGYEWLSQRNTVLLCVDHLVLLNGDEKRSGALDIVSAMGLVGGLVMGIRAAKDALATKKCELSPLIAAKLFEEKQMVWCKKSDAEIWRYERKPWMFIKANSDQLYCKFKSMAGTIHCCLVINSTDDTTADYQMENEAQFPPTWKGIDLDSFFKIVVVERNVPEKEVRKIMEASRSELPDW